VVKVIAHVSKINPVNDTSASTANALDDKPKANNRLLPNNFTFLIILSFINNPKFGGYIQLPAKRALTNMVNALIKCMKNRASKGFERAHS
jgi:hypothetical protein